MLTQPSYVSGIDERFFNRDLSWLAFNERFRSYRSTLIFPDLRIMAAAKLLFLVTC